MFKTHGLALNPGIGHSRGMFSCLRIGTMCFNVTTHGHVLLIFLRTILVGHVPCCEHRIPKVRPHHASLGPLPPLPSASALPHDCAPLPKLWPLHKQTKLCCFCGLHTGMCHTSVRFYTQLGTIWHLWGFAKADRVPTRRTQRPSASIWASKKTTCPFQTHIPDQTAPSTATSEITGDCNKGQKLTCHGDGTSCHKRLLSGTIYLYTVNGAP